MPWEVLASSPTARVRRHGRFLVVDLLAPHRVLSTSPRHGGQTEHVRHLVNHQSCEGSGHHERSRVITDQGQEAYHDLVCAEAGVPADVTVTMGTAANMNYAATVTERDEDVEVMAVVTAGVRTNAVCAGDPATWRETREGIAKVPVVAGTINTLVLVNTPVQAGALMRVAVTMTEAKSAALQQLAVPSCYSADLATGTGTDQFALAAPLDGAHPLTTASPHTKFGEIIGRAVRQATVEALRWQNGLEASYTRSLFHALGRYGLKEATIVADLADYLSAGDLELLGRNIQAVFYEPLVGASAHALGAVLDRTRHGTLPASAMREAIVQQAATLAASLAAQPERWPEFRTSLHARPSLEPKPLVLAALALGWSAKWRQ